MEQNKLYPADDYSQNYYTWPEYLHATGPLTAENVFDYFAQSVYYDKQSNNQVLRMQTQHTGVPLANEAEELKRFTGIEFAVVHAQPPLFIIHKRERLSPDEVRPLVAYFIIHNRIYISPDVYTLISNRLLTSLHALQTSLNVLRDHRPAYAPRTGFVWPIKDVTTTNTDAAKKRTHEGGVSTPDIRATPSLTDPSSKPESSSAPTGQSPTKRKQNNMLLLNAMRTTALHSSRSFVLPTAVSESTVPDTSTASATAGRSSATPAPSQSASTPKPPGSQDPLIRRESVVGKKRKKRASVVAV
ncbi:hypothetical protein PHLGIDRAFT_114593 [Phlebiopsis gigantea 11061_1 CR5-6]|uniref:Mediator of RNA polymerase II transcription subunit 6 n=1 Tax=Phlebiopsis gigantea (strain 11061_1 CR5-6) TaxID=745531 RepID=A0A0C3SF49_PHLG1|nr:hypothetical protein PHLGIDRAFT_114593 [Phlebiopsis gigantea 11061_1 CR5-6]